MNSNAIALICLSLALNISACTTLRNLMALCDYKITLANSSPHDTTIAKVALKADQKGRKARLLSAFFGLDDALPGTPQSVFFPGGFLTDPRNDLNPDTSMRITK